MEEFFAALEEDAPKVFFSKKAEALYFDHRFQAGSYLIFGKETSGLPEDLLKKFSEAVYKIPQYDDRVRSLNLANVVTLALYEAIRQLGP